MKEGRGIIDQLIIQNIKRTARAIAWFIREFYGIIISEDAVERRRKNLED